MFIILVCFLITYTYMDFHCTKRKRVNNPQLIPWEDMQELHNDMHFWILDGT